MRARGTSGRGWAPAGLGPPIGLGADELRWPRPVEPGDLIQAEWEVIETRPPASKHDRAIVRIRVITRNQRGEDVLTLITTVLVPRGGGTARHP